MANPKISSFPTDSEVTGEELLTGISGGLNQNISVQQIADFVLDQVPPSGAGSFAELTDKVTADLPGINTPLAAALAAITQTPGTTVTYNPAVSLARSNTIMDMVLDANQVLTESPTGKAAGGGGTINFQQGATARTVTFPAGWIAEDASDPISTTEGMWHRVVYYYDGHSTTYSVKQMEVGAVLTTPAAPTSFVVDDTANTGNWTNNPSYTAVSDYEQTVDGGDTYTTCTAKPISVGDVALNIGMVGVRVKAVAGVSNPSLTLYNLTAYTVSGLTTPSAPITPVSNDSTDMFGWTNTGGKGTADAEITIDGGSSYTDATTNPHSVGNVLKAAGQVGVRYKAVPGVSNASSTLFDTAGFNLITPAAPTSFVVDDTANTAGWTDAGGKTFADAEYTVDGGSSYAQATANPQTGIGNVNKAAGQVGIRYKAVASVSNASATLYNATAYLITPAAPTSGIVDDVDDEFDWTYSAGFSTPGAYEYRIGGVGSFSAVAAKPLVVGDVDIPIGDLEVRVKAVAGVNTASASLTNAAAFVEGAPVMTELYYKSFDTAIAPMTKVETNGNTATISGGYLRLLAITAGVTRVQHVAAFSITPGDQLKVTINTVNIVDASVPPQFVALGDYTTGYDWQQPLVTGATQSFDVDTTGFTFAPATPDIVISGSSSDTADMYLLDILIEKYP